MRVSYRVLASAGLLLLLANAPLSGQAYGGALGFYGGGSWFGDLTPEQAVETRLATNWLAGVQIERWSRHSRIGVRFNAEYAYREMEDADEPVFNLYSGGLSLLFRFVPPDARHGFAPYIAVGGGALHVNSGSGPDLAASYYEDPVTRPMAMFALGADLFAGSPVGLQIEVADRILIESPFGNPTTASAFRPVHQAVVRLALQLRSDRSSPAVLAFSSQDREEEAPVLEPPPAPEPAERPPATTLDSVSATVEANTAELARLRARMLDFGRALEQRWAAGAPQVSAQPSATRLYTVQVGAYRDANKARQLADRMRRTGIPVWVSQAVVSGQTFHRVRLGALSSRPAAIQLAQQLQREHSVPIWVAPVGRSEGIPPDAVPATRAFLNGS